MTDQVEVDSAPQEPGSAEQPKLNLTIGEITPELVDVYRRVIAKLEQDQRLEGMVFWILKEGKKYTIDGRDIEVPPGKAHFVYQDVKRPETEKEARKTAFMTIFSTALQEEIGKQPGLISKPPIVKGVGRTA